MSQSPNLETLLDFETQFDDIWPQVLFDVGMPVFPLQAESESLPDPRIEVHFRTQGVAGPGGIAQVFPASQPSAASCYNYSIDVALFVRRRPRGDATPGSQYRGIVRKAFSNLTGRINDHLDYVQVLTLEEADFQRGYDTERKYDIQTWTFAGYFGIKPDAWPA